MKRTMKFALVVVLSLFVGGALFSLNSCKKEATEGLMIIKKWTLVKKTLAGLDITLPCEKGGTYDFKSDNTYVVTNSCQTSPQTGTWELNEDAKTLNLNGIGLFEITESSPISLKIALKAGGKEMYTIELK